LGIFKNKNEDYIFDLGNLNDLNLFYQQVGVINKTINEHVINVIENAYNLAINTRLPIWFDDIVIQSSFEKIGNMTVIHFLRS